MKTAIILVGNIRTWDECKYSFCETFSHLNPDIFLSTYNLQYDHHPVVKNRISDFEDAFLTDDQILEKFNGLSLKGACIENFLDVSEQKKHMNPAMKNLDICFLQYRKYNIGIRMIEQLDENRDYECVIKTRCDLIYENFRIDSFLKNSEISNGVIVDSGNVFPNDCIFISSRKNMIDISNFMMSEFFDYKYPDSNINPPHGLLHNAIKNYGLNVHAHKLMNCVVRKGGKKHYY